MRIALVVPYFDDLSNEEPTATLARQHTLPGLINALSRRGAEVRGFQMSLQDAAVELAGGLVRFVAAPRWSLRAARLLTARYPRHGPAYYVPAFALLREVLEYQPDVVHLFGADLDVNLLLTAIRTRRRDLGLVVSYHGGVAPRRGLTRAVRRLGLSRAGRVLFTTREQAEPWLAARLVRKEQIAEVMETSTQVSARPRGSARLRASVAGAPACVMASRLAAIKDPINTLTGFALLAEQVPSARLHVFPASDELLSPCRGIAASTPSLRRTVTFHERAEPELMADVLSAADYLLQSSRREWSGLAVLEAMACGAVPIVTDLPPFRRMTDSGRAGRLFAVGDPRGLAAAVLAVERQGRDIVSSAVRHRFETALSFDALADDLLREYAAAYPPGARASAA